MPLRFIASEEAFETLNIVLYGRPKVGKTAGACTAPGPVLHVNAEGPDSVAYALNRDGDKVRSVSFTGRKMFPEIVAYLGDEGSDVQTVVLDTVGAMYDLMLSQERSRDPRKSYGAVNDALRAHLTWLFAQHRNVVVVAHEKEIGDGEDTIFVPSIPGRQILPYIEQNATIIGYVATVPEEDGSETRVAQLSPGKGRTCGDRTDSLGRWRSLDLTEWAEVVAKAHKSKPAEKAEPDAKKAAA